MGQDKPKALESPGTFQKDTIATKKSRKDRLKNAAAAKPKKRSAKKTSQPDSQPPADSAPKAAGDT